MRKIHLLLAALTIAVTSFAAFSGPAMANDWDNDWDHNGNNVVWQSNNGDWDNWDNDDWDSNWWWVNDWDEDWDNDWWGNNWHHGCEGPVCLID